MSNQVSYIKANTIQVVDFTDISVKVSAKGNMYAIVETASIADGSINRKFIFPFKYWETNKDKAGNIKSEATQKEEYNKQLIHIFGAANQTDIEVTRIVDQNLSFEETMIALSNLCLRDRGGRPFRMKYVETKPTDEGKIYAEFKMYSYGVTERTSVNPSKLKFIYKKKEEAKPVEASAVSVEEEGSELPF